MRACCGGFNSTYQHILSLLLVLLLSHGGSRFDKNNRQKTFLVNGLRLSSVESVLLQKRLSLIQNAMRQQMRRSTQKASPTTTEDGILDWVVIFPGAGGVDALSMELEDAIRNFGAADTHPRCISTVDWKEHRGSIATAAYDAEAVGESVGQWIWEEAKAATPPPTLRSVHSIGISVGAFAANALVDYLDQQRRKEEQEELPPVHLRLTLLDPFCSRGITGVGYGARYFGRTADYAEHFLNTDDPVPSTNEALPHCFTTDVTGASQRNSFVLPEGETMHCWPVAYYARFGYWEETSIVTNTDQTVKMVGLPTHSETRQRGSVQVQE